nr:MAG TPA: hypothetical protein [Caudoviricetes sp.]
MQCYFYKKEVRTRQSTHTQEMTFLNQEHIHYSR